MADSTEATATRPAPVNRAARRLIDDAFSLAYEELRRIASSVRSREASFTLNSTALVNEAWIKLKDSPQLAGIPTPHFKAIVARAMRQILVDAARRRNARKRGDGEGAALVPMEFIAAAPDFSDVELLSLDSAIAELEQMSPRQVQVVDCISFAGFSVSETAELLQVSESSVDRDNRSARAWLKSRIQPNLTQPTLAQPGPSQPKPTQPPLQSADD
jgi:RNA polymerase sigma factor (TIGR02999 family)